MGVHILIEYMQFYYFVSVCVSCLCKIPCRPLNTADDHSVSYGVFLTTCTYINKRGGGGIWVWFETVFMVDPKQRRGRCVWVINNDNFSFLILLFYFILIDFHAIPEFFLVKWIVLERIQCLGGG